MIRIVPIRTVSVLVGTLAMVVGLAGTGSLRASAQVEKSPPPLITFNHPVVFTMALGDPAINGKIAVLMAKRLHDNGQQNIGPVRSNAWIVPEGQWTLGDYLEQCRMDPTHTLGAFIVLPTSSANSTENWIALLRNSTDVTLSILVAECHPKLAPSPAPDASSPSPGPAATSGEASVVWASYVASGKYGRSQIEFFPLAVLTTIYLAFSPQRTYQTTSTTVFPTPAPLPATGARASVQTQQSSVLNAGGTAGLQGNVLSAFAGNGLGSTIGGQTTAESQALRAADDAIGHLMKEQLDSVCGNTPKTSSAPPSVPPAATPAPKGTPAPPTPPFCNW